MRLGILTLLIAGVTSVTSFAQQPVIEYGKPEELTGVTKIFINTGADMKNRDRMLKVFAKEKKRVPGLVVLDSPEDAEVILSFNADRESYISGVVTNPPPCQGCASTSTPTRRTVDRGAGKVFVPKAENRMRILMDFSGSASFKWTDWPSEQFAKAFIKAYLKANGDPRK